MVDSRMEKDSKKLTDNTTSDTTGKDVSNEIEVDSSDVRIFKVNDLVPSSTPITVPYLEIYRTNELEYVPYISPFNVGVNGSGNSDGLTDTGGGAGGVDVVVNEIKDFSYGSGCSDKDCLKSTKKGDCWALSDYIHSRLTEIGVESRIVQYKTGSSNRHRQVQYKSNGKWVMFPYDKSGIDHTFYTSEIPSDAKPI